MSNQRLPLTDEELSLTEADLRESLSMLSDDGDPSRKALRSALELGLNLIAEVQSERRQREYPVHTVAKDETEALKEYMGVLVPIAQIAENIWVDMARNNTPHTDMHYRQRVVSRLGGALRALKTVNARVGMNSGFGTIRPI
jgi:hypothetical protein